MMSKWVPFPMVMEDEKGRREWRLPVEEAMCVKALVSMNQSEELEPADGTPALASAARRELVSQIDGMGDCWVTSDDEPPGKDGPTMKAYCG